MNELATGDDGTRRLGVAYDRFVEQLGELSQAGRELARQAFQAASETTRRRLAAAGEVGAAHGAQIKDLLRRELGPHFEQQARQVRRLGHQTGQRLHPGRLRDGALATLAALLKSAGEKLHAWSYVADQAVIYESGEVTSPGTLTCVICGQTRRLDGTLPITSCPSCMGRLFRKSY